MKPTPRSAGSSCAWTGGPVNAEVMGRDESDQSVFYQPRRWRAGWHQAVVTVWDVAGQVTRRAWTFRII